MTYVASLLAHQAKAGQPLHVYGRLSSSFGDNDLPDGAWIGLGLTATSTPPATFAAFSHFEGGAYSAAYWIFGTDVYTDRNQAGAATAYTDRVTVGPKTIPLDANFAAGKYLWLVMSPVDPPIGATVPDIRSAPYLIR